MSIDDALFVDLRGVLPLDANRVNAVVKAGFGAAILNQSQLRGDPAEHRRLRLRVGLNRIIVALDKGDVQELEQAEAFGAAGVVVGAGNQRDARSLRSLSLTAAELGLSFAVIPSPDSDLEIAALTSASMSEVPLCLRTDRMLADDRQPATFRRLTPETLGLVLVTDRHVRGLQNGEQALPGLGHLPLAPLVALMARKGFVGPWVVSLGSKVGEPADAEVLGKAARLGRLALLHLLDQASTGEPALLPVRALLPPRVQAKGFEFIELAVDQRSRAEVEALLTALSFRLERQHRTATVELWRQGAINIVLNEEIEAAGARPFVCDMGLRVDDAQVSAQRAGMLGAHHHAPSRQPGRLPIPAMKDSLGTIVHFIDQKSDTHRVWDIEFAPALLGQVSPPAGLRRVDHMAQIMPDRELEGLMLYYLSTFGLTKRTQVGMKDPVGMVASQALETLEGEVRIALNGVDATHSPPPGTSVQHVAFQSDDIFETAAVLAAQAFETLPVPSDYYRELGARFDLQADRLARFERAGVLYDRDSAGGEFFQLYSLPLSSGLFFEIVERRGGYGGYGAANSPMRRMALAQSIADRPHGGA